MWTPVGSALQIEQIDTDNTKLVSRWNHEHPDQQVMEGDRIIEVNGVQDDLVQECKKDQKLTITISRSARVGS